MIHNFLRYMNPYEAGCRDQQLEEEFSYREIGPLIARSRAQAAASEPSPALNGRGALISRTSERVLLISFTTAEYVSSLTHRPRQE